jgi:hypothetical protein
MLRIAVLAGTAVLAIGTACPICAQTVYQCVPDEPRAAAPDRLVSVEITLKLVSQVKSICGGQPIAAEAVPSQAPAAPSPTVSYPNAEIMLPASILAATANNTPLLLFGATDHKTFLGCLNCSQYDSGSVCNQYGVNGSAYSSASIWNEYGTFGSQYSSWSVE